MYAGVVVLTNQPPDIKTYTYEIPKDIDVKIGQLVTVPFGTRNPDGVVLEISENRHPGMATTTKRELVSRKLEIGSKKDSIASLQNDKKIQLKQISSIVIDQPLLLPTQIKLLKWMSDYYHAPMVNSLEAMLPYIPKNPQSLAGGKIAKKQTTLVLVPSINRLPKTIASYPYAKNFIAYHNDMKPWERFANWQKIATGNIDHVFGTRSAIFTPIPNLAKIIIYDEHEESYKDERSPYFDTLTIAEKLSTMTGAQLSIVDSSPKVTTYTVHKNEISFSRHPGMATATKRELVSRKLEIGSKKDSIASLQNDKTLPKVKIISMLEEKAAGNKTPISDLLASYLAAAQKRNKSVLLFLNKKIDTGHFYCKGCKHNDYAPKEPEKCPECGSSDIWFYTLNVSSLSKLVQQIVPDAKTNLITEGKQSTIGNQQSTIDIATAAVFYRLQEKLYDLVVHISTDSALNAADFTAGEKTYTQITNLRQITKGLLLLQTYNPLNPTITSAADSNYQKFKETQLSERRALSYPPYSLLIKLGLKGKREESLEENSQRLFEKLNRSKNADISIVGPFKPFTTRKMQKYNIILKIPLGNYNLKTREETLFNMKDYLELVPKNWQITVEPSSLN
ncbi:MAG: hypothetical protein NUV69_01080 [Candidatus Curtissbacteria bacterium]|nr:hypothetical protein [Candidatus Curtissbacteria bacterium]